MAKAKKEKSMKKMSLEILLKKFNEEYSFLYENDGKGIYTCGYREAIAAFDDYMKVNADFVKDFSRYREDFVVSDRECAAFMFAMDSLGYLD